jgi:UDP-glucuronate decarboxylase
MNLGHPEEHSVRDVARLILRLTGSRSELAFVPLRGDDPAHRCPDISLAEKLLHWTPETPLEQGLAKTMRYARRVLRGVPRVPSAAIVA